MNDKFSKRCEAAETYNVLKEWGNVWHKSNTENRYYLAETNTYHENIPNSKTACVRTERQQVGTK